MERKIKRYKLALLGAFIYLSCHIEASALTWQDLWYTPDQQATRQLAQGHPTLAKNLFRNSEWKGVAAYRAKDYNDAVQSFARTDTALSNYNRGNALVQLGKYQDALLAYQRAIKQDPQFADARYNYEHLNQWLEKNNQSSKRQSTSSNSQRANQNQSSPNQTNASGHQQNSPASSSPSQSQKQTPTPHSLSDSETSQPESQPNMTQVHSSESIGIKANSPATSSSLPHLTPDQSPHSVQAQSLEKQGLQKSADSSKITAAQRLEEQHAQQLLQQVPDDPGGLLKNKFLRDHLRQQFPEQEDQGS